MNEYCMQSAEPCAWYRNLTEISDTDDYQRGTFIDCCISRGMDSFPGAAITKYSKPRGFKQQKCILSQLWKLEIKVSTGPFPQRNV